MILKRNKSAQTSQPIPNWPDKVEAMVIKRRPNRVWQKYRKQILVALVVLVLWTLGGIIKTLSIIDAYAVIDGQTISWEQYDRAKKAYKTLIQKNKETIASELSAEGHELLEGDVHYHPSEDVGGEVDIDNYTKNELIFNVALKKDASRSGNSLTQDEVGAAIKTDPIVYSSEGSKEPTLENVHKEYEAQLGWNKDDLERYYSTEVLKTKLNDELIDSRGVLITSTFWTKNDLNLSESQLKTVAKKTLQQVLAPWLNDKSLGRADIMSRIEGYNNQDSVAAMPSSRIEYSYIPRMSRDDLISYIDTSNYYTDTPDILDMLNEKRDRTKILESRDEFFTILWVDEKSEGEYGSWEDYVENKIRDASFFDRDGWDINRLFYGLTHVMEVGV